jgi:hypothetical protein
LKRILSVEERFWGKVTKTGEDGCWVWQGYLGKEGYGYFKVAGKQIRVNRFSYALANLDNPLGPGDFVCHSCDNPPCVNPKHLWKGTHTDNMHDMFRKGRRRAATGERAGRHVLTKEQVEIIRTLYAKGEKTQTELAKIYGCSQSNIGHVVRGEMWKTCPGPISPHVKPRKRDNVLERINF